ncbi:MAG: carboxypeptidase-like regulatory domain-containing protein, partial [Muribaculaceae bacterium]|nr:carboxypeptidase-like regulatory domain-containing protein [Muribaculaceae bacterium]
MRQKFLILCIALGLLSATAADPATLSGIVRDALTSEPIAGVIVKTKGIFTSTDKDGKFYLSPKSVT